MLGSFCSQGYLLPKAWTLVHSNKAFQWTENHHPSSSKSRYQPFSAREFLTLIINLYITYGWIIYPLAFLHSYWEKHSCFTGKPSIHQPFSMVILVYWKVINILTTLQWHWQIPNFLERAQQLHQIPGVGLCRNCSWNPNDLKVVLFRKPHEHFKDSTFTWSMPVNSCCDYCPGFEPLNPVQVWTLESCCFSCWRRIN